MYIRCYKGVNVMAVVRDFYLENGCHFKINDAELLPEELLPLPAASCCSHFSSKP